MILDRYNMRFNVALSAKGNIDLIQIMEKCSRLPQQFPLLNAETEERVREYSWRWSAFPSIISTPNLSELVERRGELVISDVEVYSDIRTTAPLIQRIEFDLPDEKWVVRKED